ncbi:TRL-like family protein [candidate division CSSED10-310 bacterium]|uniref:TRL-like family protein n=1 Tax=candidate division CSSED10-310 bacterium TaxID=2855610 RepID=A0ABV6Z4H6_UNCC1
MRHSVLLIALFICTTGFLGCATVMSPVGNGTIFTDVKGPLTVTDATEYSKVGQASAMSVLGIVVTGDASISAAMKNGGITKVHHVDHESKNILGVYARFTTIVYGE